MKPRLLSRTLSDTPITDPPSSQMLTSSPDSSLSDDASFSLCPSLASTAFRSSVASQPEEGDSAVLHHHTVANEMLLFEGSAPGKHEDGEQEQVDDVSAGSQDLSGSEDENHRAQTRDKEEDEEGAGEANDIRERRSNGEEACVRVCEEREVALEPMLLYEHRVRGLVLLLLVEPGFDTHPNAKQEVVSSVCLCACACVHHCTTTLLHHLRYRSNQNKGFPVTMTTTHTNPAVLFSTARSVRTILFSRRQFGAQLMSPYGQETLF